MNKIETLMIHFKNIGPTLYGFKILCKAEMFQIVEVETSHLCSRVFDKCSQPHVN